MALNLPTPRPIEDEIMGVFCHYFRKQDVNIVSKVETMSNGLCSHLFQIL